MKHLDQSWFSCDGSCDNPWNQSTKTWRLWWRRWPFKHVWNTSFCVRKKVNFPTAKSAQSEMAVNLTHHDVQRMPFGNWRLDYRFANPSFSGCSPRFPVSPEIPNIKSNISTPGSERRNARFNADNCPCPELERYKPEFLRRLLEGWEKWQKQNYSKKKH